MNEEYVVAALGYGFLESSKNGTHTWTNDFDKIKKFPSERHAKTQCQHKGMPPHAGVLTLAAAQHITRRQP